jgi:hypothetical protein
MADRTSPDQPEAESFSDGVDNVIALVRPHGRPETAFPTGLDVADTRRVSGEDLHGWFVRLVDKYCRGDPQLIAVEVNVALMAKFRWEKDRLVYASVPTLVAAVTLDEYYLDGGSATYFRLDLNSETLGEPFSHPLPHIHVGDADSPRFALDGGTSGNVVMDFLEFIYRNHVPTKWLRWARRQWLAEGADEQRAGQFEEIVRAFRGSDLDALRANAHVISQVKRTLREAKDKLFKATMDGTDRERRFPVGIAQIAGAWSSPAGSDSRRAHSNSSCRKAMSDTSLHSAEGQAIALWEW